MLARIAVHLPESLWLQENTRFDSFTATLDGETLVVYPPLQSSFEVRPDPQGNFNVNDIFKLLTPVQPERIYPFVRMNGQLVKHANLLQIDIVGRDFRRDAGATQDPSGAFVERVVVNFVARMRYTIGAPSVREFRLLETFWTIRYLADDGSELVEEKGLVRGRVHAPFKFQFTGLDESSWGRVKNLTFSFRPLIWERLYLDALFLLPEVGPALMLAMSAIETATDQMIEERLQGDQKEAEKLIAANRLGQRLDRVAKQLTGVSLKANASLWSAFDRLRRARNMAAHEGTPVLDGVVVTDGVAQEMILAIRPVIDWVEHLMGPELRGHRDPNQPTWEWRPPVHSATPGNTDPSESIDERASAVDGGGCDHGAAARLRQRPCRHDGELAKGAWTNFTT